MAWGASINCARRTTARGAWGTWNSSIHHWWTTEAITSWLATSTSVYCMFVY